MATENQIQKNDVVRISKEGYVSLGKVTDAWEDGVIIFRDGGDAMYLFEEYEIEKLGTAIVDMY